MTHFLGRLVERARGNAPRVEPVVASRFSTAALAEISNEPKPAATEHVEASRSARATSPAAPSQSPTSAEGSPPSPSSVGQENASSMPLAERPQEKIAIVPETLLVPQILEKESPILVRQQKSQSETIAEQALRPKAGRTSPGKSPGVRFASQIQRPVERSSPNESGVEWPIARVTIGRIEVRAVAPPPAPLRKPNAPRKPTLTLDAYLKTRNEALR